MQKGVKSIFRVIFATFGSAHILELCMLSGNWRIRSLVFYCQH